MAINCIYCDKSNIISCDWGDPIVYNHIQVVQCDGCEKDFGVMFLCNSDDVAIIKMFEIKEKVLDFENESYCIKSCFNDALESQKTKK